MSLKRIAPVIVATALFAVPSALAAGEQHHFRFNVGYLMPSGDYSFNEDGISGKAEFDDGFGVGLGYEYRVTPMIGIDVGLGYYASDVKLSAEGQTIDDSGSILPLTVGAMFHFGSRADFFVGPEVGWVSYGDVRIEDLDDVEFDGEFIYGAKAGVNVPINDTWSFNGSLEYLVMTGEVKDSSPAAELDPNPFIVSVGASMRF